MTPILRVDRPNVIDEEFDGESVVMNLATGAYYALNAAASSVWRLFAEPRSLPQLSDAHHESEHLAELVVFIDLLMSELLLVEDDGAEFTAVVSGPLAGPFEMQRFDDMADLLLLDPVHDIDISGTGWPVRTDSPVPSA